MFLQLTSAKGPLTTQFKMELPDFALLTGLNGSGKTQLLEAIQEGHIYLYENENQPDQSRIVSFKYLPINSLIGSHETLYDKGSNPQLYKQAFHAYDVNRNRFSQRYSPPTGITFKDLETIKYVSGLELKLPKWYLLYRGHLLEKLLKCKFEILNRCRNEELKIEIVKKVIDDFPEFIPYDFLKLFKEIQNN